MLVYRKKKNGRKQINQTFNFIRLRRKGSILINMDTATSKWKVYNGTDNSIKILKNVKKADFKF